MNEQKQTAFQSFFDRKRRRRYFDGNRTAIHSHHYAVLYTQLAADAEDFNGIVHLKRASEDTFYKILKNHYEKNGIDTLPSKIEAAQSYWENVGMGNILFTGVGKYTITAEMSASHVDEGWMEKFGKSSVPVNFITQGFVAAVSALVTGKHPRSFTVREIRSLVKGDSKSVFKAVIE